MFDTVLLKLISDRLDPDELIDMLGLTTKELAFIFMVEIMEKREDFEAFLGFEEFEDGWGISDDELIFNNEEDQLND